MEKQKIGIVTWFFAANPGTAFQAYALQQYINSLPHCKAELVNYKYEAGYNNIAFAHGYGPLSWAVRTLLNVRKYMFCSFQRKNIVYYPKKKISRKKLSCINDRYDQFILGSDQIWNVKFTEFDKTFFLDFVSRKRKGAYAPSLGKDEWPEEYREQIRQYLSDFAFIGVREKQSVNVVQPLTDKQVHWSLDPTFLLKKEDWKRIARNPDEGDYIFEYCITKSPTIRQATERLSEMTGLPVVEYGGVRKRVPSAKRMPHPSADTWLGYLVNAKYVITDSFHGCAFSINTNTNFFVMVTANGSRLYSVLELFCLQDRILSDGMEINLSRTIDWESVNRILEERRNESREWLKKSLLG